VAAVMRVFEVALVRDGDALPAWTLATASVCLGLDWGDPAPHCWQGWTSLFGDPSRWWRPAKDLEARSVVALSRVPCGEQGVLVSPPAADQMSWRALAPQAAGRPLVRLPTDRHTATGTCEIGQRCK